MSATNRSAGLRKPGIRLVKCCVTTRLQRRLALVGVREALLPQHFLADLRLSLRLFGLLGGNELPGDAPDFASTVELAEDNVVGTVI